MCLNLTWHCNLLPKSHATWSASNRISFQILDHTFEIYRSYSRIPLLFCLVYLYSHPSHSRTNRTPTEMPSQKHFFFHIPLKLKLYLKIWRLLQQKEHFCLHNNRYNVYNCWIVCLISLLANFYKLIFSRFFFNVYVRREALKKDRNKGANLSLRCYKPGRNVLQTVQTKPFQL